MYSLSKNGHKSYGIVQAECHITQKTGLQEIISLATPVVLRTVDNIKFEKGDKPFVICEYGTSDGGNSMSLIRTLIKAVKLKYGEAQPVHMIYEDQPENDFQPLFSAIQGEHSDLHNFKEVYVTASGTSFYSQCLPAETVHLGLSFTAMHWLSRRPCNLSDSILHLENQNATENKMFKDQAAKDWEILLLNRAKELAHGGQIIMAIGCVDKIGQWIGKTEGMKTSHIETMVNIWKSMVTKEEFINTTINVYYRTEAEIRAPFEDPESAVSKAGLRLDETKILYAKCPLYKEWSMSKKTKADAAVHAKKLATSQKFWLTNVFISGLSDRRSTKEKEEIVDGFFQKFEDLIAENPEDYFRDFVEMMLHIKKI